MGWWCWSAVMCAPFPDFVSVCLHSIPKDFNSCSADRPAAVRRVFPHAGSPPSVGAFRAGVLRSGGSAGAGACRTVLRETRYSLARQRIDKPLTLASRRILANSSTLDSSTSLHRWEKPHLFGDGDGRPARLPERQPCRGVQLPSGEKAEDEARFLTHAEFGLSLEGMGERYKAFTQFLVMTGTRFGEATAVTVADVDLMSKPATMRINKAWKRGTDPEFYVGATKTGAGKRTVSLNPHLVEVLIPLVASRPGSELLYTTPKGERIVHKLNWHHYWVPDVEAAQARGL